MEISSPLPWGEGPAAGAFTSRRGNGGFLHESTEQVKTQKANCKGGDRAYFRLLTLAICHLTRSSALRTFTFSLRSRKEDDAAF